MKRYLYILFVVLGLQALPAQTTTPEPTGVKLTPEWLPSTVILSKFSTDYPNVKPVWTSYEDGSCSAEYRLEETNMGRIVRYDKTGKLLSLENELRNDAYPTSIGRYYVKKYPHEKYIIWSYEDAAGNKSYYANREQETVWFDRNGKFMPSKTTRVGPSKMAVAGN
jgi:hypothetical protein